MPTCSVRPAVQASSNAPPTTMPLILAGVIANKDNPDRGQAIIGSSAADAKLYSVGAAIVGGRPPARRIQRPGAAGAQWRAGDA